MNVRIGMLGVVALVVLGAVFLTSSNSVSEDAVGQDETEQILGLPEQEMNIEDAVATDRDPAPVIAFSDYDGNIVTLEQSVGKLRVVNAWATWCPFCKRELPDFVTVQNEFRDDVVFIAINRGEGLEASKEYTDNFGITDELIWLIDEDDSFYRAIGGFGMPETLFVDGEGNIIEHKRGPMGETELRSRVERYLAEIN